MMLAEETRINNLRIRTRGGGTDPRSARSRMGSLLSQVTFQPRALPSSAIVCMRRLRDPKPGMLRLWQADTRPPRAWEEAVTASIDRLTRQAARPALGYVPPDAEAVLFLDRSELLACLARDWSEGSAIARWWWKSLFRDSVTAGTIMHAWLETPEYDPGALRILAEQGKAAAFAYKLSRNEAVALVRGMTEKFGLARLQAALDGQPIRKEESRSESKESTARPSSSSDAEISIDPTEESNGGEFPAASISATERPSSSGKSISSPWPWFAPESSSPSLGPEQQALIGVGLMLNRQPSEIREKSFAEAISRWKRAATTASPSSPKLSVESAWEPGAASRELNSRLEPTPSRHSWRDPKPGDSSENFPGSVLRRHDERTDFTITGLNNPESRSDTPVTGKDAFLSPETISGSRDISPAKQSEALQPDLLNEIVIDTELGGLFYLINLGLFLGLYGDFTTPRTPGIDLDIWDFITLLGKRLIGDSRTDDPVWPLLTRLACRREGDAPGSGFEPPDEWRVPPAWLEAFAEKSRWQWDAQAERLKVVHGEGFTVLNVRRTEEKAEDQLERETREYKTTAAYILKQGPVFDHGENSSPIERWLDHLVPYVQARLLRALGLSPSDKLSDVLLRRQARAEITNVSVDVHYPLEDLPVDIRVAGLDRDPGWVPAAGRYVKFHYE